MPKVKLKSSCKMMMEMTIFFIVTVNTTIATLLLLLHTDAFSDLYGHPVRESIVEPYYSRPKTFIDYLFMYMTVCSSVFLFEVIIRLTSSESEYYQQTVLAFKQNDDFYHEKVNMLQRQIDSMKHYNQVVAQQHADPPPATQLKDTSSIEMRSFEEDSSYHEEEMQPAKQSMEAFDIMVKAFAPSLESAAPSSKSSLDESEDNFPIISDRDQRSSVNGARCKKHLTALLSGLRKGPRLHFNNPVAMTITM
ncbi:hypothetical protein Ciccas_002267 [Cichlidogyrus casuarinus]|uniref:Uncharacterized protein n=1 Tax=Cichlidogyrus casuarinus TaxID=1844966 RepID=A0ABD2QHY7_9PLAT